MNELLVDRECELAVIACTFLNLDARYIAFEQVTPEDFGCPDNRILWKHVLALAADGQPINRTLLKASLEATDELRLVGGVEYLAGITQLFPLAEDINAYIGLLRSRAIRRRSLELFEQSARNLRSPTIPAEATLGDLISGLATLQARYTEQTLEAELRDYWRAWDEFKLNSHIYPSWPWPEVAATVGPFSGTRLIVLAGISGQGKTTIASQTAFYLAQQQHRVVYFALEMSRAQVVDVIWRQYGTRTTAELPAEDRDAVITHLAKFPFDLFSVSEVGNDFASIVYRIRALASQGMRVAFIDYLGLMRSPAKFKQAAYERIGEMTHTLKHLALSLKIDIVLVVQLNRAPGKEKRAPEMFDLRESGDIENDADLILLLDRPGARTSGGAFDEGQKNKDLHVIVAKHRFGAVPEDPIVIQKEQRPSGQFDGTIN